MFSRSVLVVGLFLHMSVALHAQFVQNPMGQMTPSQQREVMKQMQRQNMLQQMQQNLQAQQQGGVPFDATGTIDTIGSGQIKMIDDKGTERMVHYNKQTVVKTSGEATPEFLRPGLLVEFKTEVDTKGYAPGKVEELTIISVSKENPAGIFPEGGDAEAKPAAKSGAKTAAKSASGSKAKKGASAVMSKVVGHVKSAKGGKLQVQAGRTSVQCELSEGVKIAVDMNDGNFAVRGDKIEVKGTSMPNTPNMAQAQTITITLAEPLGLSKKKSEPAKSDSKRPPKAFKPKAGAGLPAPAEDR